MNMRTPSTPSLEELTKELVFTNSRSSGPGGQNVNKVNSKVSLRLDVKHSIVLTEEQKEFIAKKLSTRLTKEGVLVISAQDKRSQSQNKEAVIARLNDVLIKVFTPHKARKSTKPTKSSTRERIKAKKHRSEKKQWRQRPGG